MRFSPSPLSLGISAIRRLVETTDPASGRDILHGIVATFSAFQRERCLENMRLVFGPLGWTSASVEELRQAHIEYLTDYLYSLIRLARSTPVEFSARMRLAGVDRLQDSLNAGRGAIIITSHLGSAFHVRAGLSAHGYRVASVSNRLPVAGLEAIFEDIRTRFGIAGRHVGTGATALAEETLARNGLFSLSFDVSTPQRLEHSSWYPLGNAAIHLDNGPARLVLRTAVPAFWAKEKAAPEGRVEITLDKLDISSGGESPPAVEGLTRKWIERLYGEILERPAEWWHWNNLVLRPSGEA